MPAFANGHSHPKNSQSTTPFPDHQPAAQHGSPRTLPASPHPRLLIGPDYGTTYSSVVVAAHAPDMSGFDWAFATGYPVAAAQGAASERQGDIDPRQPMYHGTQPGTPTLDVADMSSTNSSLSVCLATLTSPSYH